jgi:hypothetical protein
MAYICGWVNIQVKMNRCEFTLAEVRLYSSKLSTVFCYTVWPSPVSDTLTLTEVRLYSNKQLTVYCYTV